MVDALINGVLAGYGIAIPVGAIAILIVTTGMRCGFACAASAGAGAATADLVYATVAVTAGTAAARALEPWAGHIRIISAVVLVILALGGLTRLRATDKASAALVTPQRTDLAATYARFLGLTIINPLTIVYFGTMVLGSTVGKSLNFAEAAVFVAGAFAASLSWQTLLAAVGAGARRGLSSRLRTVTSVVGNLFILGLAVRILL
jgi:arginine exporter protein ArgO